MTTKTVREFSAYGPCLTLGEYTGETAKFVKFVDNGKPGWKRKGQLIHTEPCKRCRDHSATTYPNGYMD